MPCSTDVTTDENEHGTSLTTRLGQLRTSRGVSEIFSGRSPILNFRRMLLLCLTATPITFNLTYTSWICSHRSYQKELSLYLRSQQRHRSNPQSDTPVTCSLYSQWTTPASTSLKKSLVGCHQPTISNYSNSYNKRIRKRRCKNVRLFLPDPTPTCAPEF